MLDPARVGEILINWVHASGKLGHIRPQGTSVYFHPQDEEGEFVRAMIDNEKVQDLVRRWPELHNVDAEEMYRPEGSPRPESEPYRLRSVQGGKREPGWGRLER